MEDIEKVLSLLVTLADLGIKFSVKNGDTVYIKNLDEKTIRLLCAILMSEPDEHSEEEEGFRLWWD